MIVPMNILHRNGTLNTLRQNHKYSSILCRNYYHVCFSSLSVPVPYHAIFSFLLQCQNIDILSEIFLTQNIFWRKSKRMND